MKLWDEAEIINLPAQQGGDPRVLVKRKEGRIYGTSGEELVYLPGRTCISLFTGCGGMDLGIERAGFVTLCQHEWAGAACETLIANRPDCFRYSALIQGDIARTPTIMLLREAGLYVGECDLVCGGPPCQGFTTSNPRARQIGYDARNDLVFQFVRVVRETQCRFFCMENVPGIFSFNKGEYVSAFLQAMHAAGYEMVYGLANAVEYGVPQDRCRFICMGTRRDLFEIDGSLAALPRPTHFGEQDIIRLNLIEGLHSAEAEAERNRIYRAPGIRYFPDRPVLRPPDPAGNHGQRSATFHNFYARLESEEPDRVIHVPVDYQPA